MRTVAIFGGTFDPIHNGHIQTSQNIQKHFQFDAYYFLPCNLPILKAPASATNKQRIEMLKLALNNHTDFTIDLQELQRNSPSYMVDTLSHFRRIEPAASLTLIMGYDSFLTLPNWHRWQELTQLANILVINRAQFSHHRIPEPINQLLKHHSSDSTNKLLDQTAGTICFFDAGNYEISSTEIRSKLKKHISVEHELPKEVYEYIKQWKLYQ